MGKEDNKNEGFMEKLASEIFSLPFVTVSVAYGTYYGFNEVTTLDTFGG